MTENTSVSTPPAETPDGAFDAQEVVFAVLGHVNTILTASEVTSVLDADGADDTIVSAAVALAELLEEVDTFVSNGGVITLTPAGTFTGSYTLPGRA